MFSVAVAIAQQRGAQPARRQRVAGLFRGGEEAAVGVHGMQVGDRSGFILDERDLAAVGAHERRQNAAAVQVVRVPPGIVIAYAVLPSSKASRVPSRESEGVL